MNLQNAAPRRKAALVAMCLVMAFSPATITTAFQQPQGTPRTPSKSTSSSSSSSSLSSDSVWSEKASRRVPHIIVDGIGINPGGPAQEEFTRGGGGRSTLRKNDHPASTVVAGRSATGDLSSAVDEIMDSYWGPRILLACIACFYGTNFPLGSIMDRALPASAATSGRFLLASLSLSPFLPRIEKDLVGRSLFAGCVTAIGYVAQSSALVDTPPATVSFLGAMSVVWCPFLEWLVDGEPMSITDRPQTWSAAALCITGVGILELCGGGGDGSSSCLCVGTGDALALLQAICFGTGLFVTEKMVRERPDQALPVTSTVVATTGFFSMIWALSDGWMNTVPGWESMTLPRLFFEPSMRDVAGAIAWTGIASTSLSLFLENCSLRKVPPTEATVILSTEPLWAAAFASVLMGESFGWNDCVGGALIVSACLVNCLTRSDFRALLPGRDGRNEEAP